MKPRSSNTTLKAVFLCTGFLAASLVWLAGPLADRPAAAADADGGDTPGTRLTAPLAESPLVIDQLKGMSAPPDDANSAIPISNPVFAYLISGTWVEAFHGPVLDLQTMHNIRADGTIDWFGSWFHGNGSGNYIYGPIYGTWEQTGPREITSIQVGFLMAGDGSFTGTGRVHMDIVFDEDFQSFSYSGIEEIIPPDQDPADPDAVVLYAGSFTNLAPVNRLNFMD